MTAAIEQARAELAEAIADETVWRVTLRGEIDDALRDELAARGHDDGRISAYLTALEQVRVLHDQLFPKRDRAAWRTYSALFAALAPPRGRLTEDWPHRDEITLLRHAFLEIPTANEHDLVWAMTELRRRVHQTVDWKIAWDVSAVLTAFGASFRGDAQEQAFKERDIADILTVVLSAKASGDFPVSRDHIAELATSTITAAQIQAAALWSEPSVAITQAILANTARGTHLVFPYFRPGQRTPAAYRTKRTDAPTKRAGGYRNRTGAPAGIYYPPGVLSRGDLNSVERPLIVTEGEKKALALDRMGYATIGLPGVWMARDATTPRGKLVLHRWIREDVLVQGREVIIAFDRDLLSNRRVRQAARRTVAMFLGAGARQVRLVDWSDTPHEHAKGVDDLAQAGGDQLVHDLIAQARAVVASAVGAFAVPRRLTSMTTVSAAQKVAYAALAACLGGRAGTVDLATVGAVMRRSPQAAGHLVRELDALGFVRTRPGAATHTERGWTQAPNSYELVRFAGAQQEADLVLDQADLDAGDSACLVLAALRARATDTAGIALAVGVSTRTARRTLQGLGPRVTKVGRLWRA